MDSRLQSPPPDDAGTKTTFRKPSNDAANRKYRRRSPVSGSSSADGSPRRDHSSSPISSREDTVKVSEHRQRRDDDRREVDGVSGRSQYDRGGDSYKYSDRQSTRGSHGYSRYGDYRHGNEHNRSRDYSRNADKYSWDKYDGSGYRSKDKENETSSLDRLKYKDSSSDRAGYGRRHVSSNINEVERNRSARDRDVRDEKRDHRKSSGDHRSDLTLPREESRGHRHDLTSERDNGQQQFKEAYKNDPKEPDFQKVAKGEKKYDDRESNKEKDWHGRAPGEKFADKSVFGSKDQESPSKKPKLFREENSTDYVKVSKFSGPLADDKPLSISKQSQEADGNSGETLSANDINAAKVAAMKAAELVNRNIFGGNYLSTDQKKKLLWGSKKSSTAEEPGHRWDTSLFGDRERQEKFNKLMGVKGDVKLEQKASSQEGSDLQAEKQKELQQDLEKQYTAGLRRRDGRTVGLGL